MARASNRDVLLACPVGRPWGRPGIYAGGITQRTSTQAWERLGFPQYEPEDVAGAGHLQDSLPSNLDPHR